MNMKRKSWIGLVIGVALVVGGLGLTGRSQTKDDPPPKKDAKKEEPPTGKQVLMRDKLTYANKALEGLSVEDFAKVVESAQMMRMISRASSWYVLDSDEYTRLSKNFQEQAVDLERHAKEKNLEMAGLDYMRISLTCIHCHKYVREARNQKKPCRRRLRRRSRNGVNAPFPNFPFGSRFKTWGRLPACRCLAGWKPAPRGF